MLNSYGYQACVDEIPVEIFKLVRVLRRVQEDTPHLTS